MQTVVPYEPLFVLCRRCAKETLNAGDGLCVGCRTLAQIKAIAGLPAGEAGITIGNSDQQDFEQHVKRGEQDGRNG